nr:hypothetical protein Iba_chr11cCG10860 [Ipomoea batatas]
MPLTCSRSPSSLPIFAAAATSLVFSFVSIIPSLRLFSCVLAAAATVAVDHSYEAILSDSKMYRLIYERMRHCSPSTDQLEIHSIRDLRVKVARVISSYVCMTGNYDENGNNSLRSSQVDRIERRDLCSLPGSCALPLTLILEVLSLGLQPFAIFAESYDLSDPTVADSSNIDFFVQWLHHCFGANVLSSHRPSSPHCYNCFGVQEDTAVWGSAASTSPSRLLLQAVIGSCSCMRWECIIGGLRWCLHLHLHLSSESIAWPGHSKSTNPASAALGVSFRDAGHSGRIHESSFAAVLSGTGGTVSLQLVQGTFNLVSRLCDAESNGLPKKCYPLLRQRESAKRPSFFTDCAQLTKCFIYGSNNSFLLTTLVLAVDALQDLLWFLLTCLFSLIPSHKMLLLIRACCCGRYRFKHYVLDSIPPRSLISALFGIN